VNNKHLDLYILLVLGIHKEHLYGQVEPEVFLLLVE